MVFKSFSIQTLTFVNTHPSVVAQHGSLGLYSSENNMISMKSVYSKTIVNSYEADQTEYLKEGKRP